MPDNTIQIEVKGLDKLMAKFDKFPKEIAKAFKAAGDEAANRVLLKTTGLQKYPPEGAANKPPTPYYSRGLGTVTAKGIRRTSERMRAQWYVDHKSTETAIGNRASYARWVHGEEQAQAMGSKGWRKLWDVAKEKTGYITKVYSAWVNKLINDLGL